MPHLISLHKGNAALREQKQIKSQEVTFKKSQEKSSLQTVERKKTGKKYGVVYWKNLNFYIN